jgi:hypothetical protein
MCSIILRNLNMRHPWKQESSSVVRNHHYWLMTFPQTNKIKEIFQQKNHLLRTLNQYLNSFASRVSERTQLRPRSLASRTRSLRRNKIAAKGRRCPPFYNHLLPLQVKRVKQTLLISIPNLLTLIEESRKQRQKRRLSTRLNQAFLKKKLTTQKSRSRMLIVSAIPSVHLWVFMFMKSNAWTT